MEPFRDDTKNTSDLNFAPGQASPRCLARASSIDRRIKLRKWRKRERKERILAECGVDGIDPDINPDRPAKRRLERTTRSEQNPKGHFTTFVFEERNHSRFHTIFEVYSRNKTDRTDKRNCRAESHEE